MSSACASIPSLAYTNPSLLGVNEVLKTKGIKLVFFAIIAIAVAFLFLRKKQESPSSHYRIAGAEASRNLPTPISRSGLPADARWRRTAHPTEQEPAEQIVGAKLAKFGQSRRRLAEQMAKKNGVAVPPEVEAFFAAVESGDWKRIEATFSAISAGDDSASRNQKRSPNVDKLWPAIIDAFGAAEQVHLLPATELLDYGHSILDSLRPGMVYVGGTDSSRWVPALINDTEEGDRHIVITQNGLADQTYLDYVALQFADRMNTLDHSEAEKIFDAYKTDARKRLEHDENHPDEPKQLRPAENLKLVDGKLEVGGQTAFMDINERLLNKLLAKNPDLSFAVGESYAMKGTYADAVPLDGLMELRANANENFTAERASDALEYWRNTADLVLKNPEASASENTKKNHSHDAGATANLLAAHGFNSEAERAYEVARELWPGSPDVAAGLAELYERTGRTAEREQLLEAFVRQFPAEQNSLKDLWGLEPSRP